MQRSVVPGFDDLAGLVAYLGGNPNLFLSSATVMTATIVAVAGAVAVGAIRWPGSERLVARAAAALTLVFAYFGLGSFALSVEILVRFHSAIPVETETQFVSGIGHLGLAALGVAIVLPQARRRRPDWLLANAVALLYWALEVLLLDPPWFGFQGQGALIRLVALATIAALALATTLAALARRAAPRARHPAGAVARISSG